MIERLAQLVYWVSCAFAAVGVIGALFWLINGVLYGGDEMAFIIAAMFGLSAVLSYAVSLSVLDGGLMRNSIRSLGLWLSELVQRLIRWFWIAGRFKS